MFHREKNYAQVSYTAKEKDKVSYKISLNNRYQLTVSGQDTYAARGSWISPATFVLEYEMIGYSSKGKWTLTLDGNDLTLEEAGVTGVYTYGGKSI